MEMLATLSSPDTQEYLNDHPTGDKEVAGRGSGGNNASFQKWRLSLKIFCHQQLRRLSLTISCRHFQLRSSGGIGCRDCRLKLSVETNCWDLFRSVVKFTYFYHPLRFPVEVSWDDLWNQLSRLPVKVSPWVYLLRSMFEINIICWNQQLILYVEISCWDSLVKSLVEIRDWDYLLRSNDQVMCWDQLLKSSVEINL